jgi:hypothetical protein
VSIAESYESDEPGTRFVIDVPNFGR